MSESIFSSKIRRLRKESGYTQEEVSRMLNIQRQTYSNYENALRVPPIEIIVSLSELYHITLDSLLKDTMPITASDHSSVPVPEQRRLIQEYAYLSAQKRKEVLEFIEFKKKLPD